MLGERGIEFWDWLVEHKRPLTFVDGFRDLRFLSFRRSSVISHVLRFWCPVKCALAVALVGLAQLSYGANLSAQSNHEIREFRRELRRLEPTLRYKDNIRNSEAEEPKWNLSGFLGAVYSTSNDGGRTFLTPLLLKAQQDKSRWSFSLSTDGYNRNTSGGLTLAGFSDLNLAAAYALDLGPDALEASLSLLMPSHSDTGSSAYKQSFGLDMFHSFGLFTAKIINRLSHTNNEPTLGVSHWANYHGLGLDYNFCPLPQKGAKSQCAERKIFVSADRNFLKGAEGTSIAQLGYSWTVSGPWGATFSGGKNLRGPTRSSFVGFELDYNF
jgi:hypothetical protein